MKGFLLKTICLSVLFAGTLNLSAQNQRVIRGYEELKNIESVKQRGAEAPQVGTLEKSSRVIEYSKPLVAAPAAVPAAKYAYPFTTAGLGTSDDTFASFLSFNKVNNRRISETNCDYLIAPKDSTIIYFDLSTNAPQSFQWTIPGGTPATLQTQDAEVTYKEEGSYKFPTLKAINADGNSSFTANLNIKAGGKGEISQVNFYKFLDTWYPSVYEWVGGAGYVCGSNTLETVAFGNVFALGQDGASIESVSVYIGANPTAANPDNEVRCSIYAMGVVDGYLVHDYELIASTTLKVSQMVADASNIVVPALHYTSDNSPVFGAALFKFDKPVEVPNLVFITIDNFGNDLDNGDDFVIMMDTETEAPSPADWYTFNSWFLAPATNGNFYWWSLAEDVFSGYHDNPTLFIFPVIKYADGPPSGIADNKVETKVRVARTEKNSFELTYPATATSVEVYNIAGQKVGEYKLNASGTYTLSAAGLANGAYILKFNGSNEVVKILK